MNLENFNELDNCDLLLLNGGRWSDTAQAVGAGLIFTGSVLGAIGTAATGQWYATAGCITLASYSFEILSSIGR